MNRNCSTFIKSTHGNCCKDLRCRNAAGEYQSLLQPVFGSLPFITQPLKPATGRERYRERSQWRASAIRIARPFPNRHHPDFVRIQQYFILFLASRLMSNIRKIKVIPMVSSQLPKSYPAGMGSKVLKRGAMYAQPPSKKCTKK